VKNNEKQASLDITQSKCMPPPI